MTDPNALSRRAFVTSASIGFVGTVMGNVLPARGGASGNNPPTPLSPLIDVHCHIFNGMDLPVENFIRIVFCKCYPPQTKTAVPLKCTACAIGALGLAIVQKFAPTANSELDDLRKGILSGPAPETGLSTEQFEIVIEAFGDASPVRDDAKDLRERFEDIRRSQGITDGAVRKLKDEIREGAEAAPGGEPDKGPAANLSNERRLIGRRLRWIGLFVQNRGALLRRLQAFYAAEGLETAVLVPGLVDLSKWLNQEPDKDSTTQLQIELMGELARNANYPPVHGYVSFDPMRAVFYKHKLDKINPLKLIQFAIEEHGFLGVKLYPPMGFLPFQNAEKRPSEFADFIVDALPTGIELREALDNELRELYEYCTKNDVPIMAHASASIGSHVTYEQFADPKNWSYTLEEFDELRVNLAHLGRFYGAQGDDFSKTFEWHFGSLLEKFPNAKLYADISYLEQILTGTGDELRRISNGFKQFIAKFDSKVEHLMFGSDWTMIGLVKGHQNYVQEVAEFFSDSKRGVGLSDEQLQNLFFKNAQSFLTLERGSQTMKRLEEFYGAEHRSKFDKLCRAVCS